MKVQESNTRRPGLGREANGEVTAFLALIFLLLISFTGAVMESASIQMAKNYRRADMNRAVESVFAEYQRELLEEFDLFAIAGGYGTGRYSEELVQGRLAYYGAADIKNDVTRIQFLTDYGGKAFQEQVEAYIQHKYGLDSLKSYLGLTETWKEQEEKSYKYQREEQEADTSLDKLLNENEGELPEENNPLPNMEQIRKRPLTELVMPKDRPVSEKKIETESLVSVRDKNAGFGTFEDVAQEKTVTTLALGEYVLEHFSSAVTDNTSDKKIPGQRTGPLDYEVEYILGGRASDRENLDVVVKKLLMLRFAPNYGYILSDGGMRAEAEGLALTLCTLIALPAITEAVTQVLLLAWAFGESIMDLRSLLSGSRVPLMKTKESWQLQLSSLLTLGTEEDRKEGMDTENGLSYKEYLRMILFLTDKETISMRCLDLIEKRIQKEKGLQWFKADICIVKMEIKSRCALRRGSSYQFHTYYGYR